MGLWPFSLKLGSGKKLEKANVQYDGKLRAVPSEMQYGGVLEFDGVDDYVDTPCELVSGDVTLAATVTCSGEVGNVTILEHTFSSTTRVALGRAGRDLGVFLYDGNSHTLAISLVLGQSYRLVGGLIDGALTLFIDGVNITRTAGSLSISSEGICIGRRDAAGDQYFDGQISNVQIWNAAFTADDVAYDYANQSTTADTREGTSLTRANLKGHWKLDEQWGLTAADSSDNGNDGTLVGFGTRDYPRLRDTGKAPKDNAILHSGQMLDFNSAGSEYVDCGSVSGISLGGPFAALVSAEYTGLSGAPFYTTPTNNLWVRFISSNRFYISWYDSGINLHNELISIPSVIVGINRVVINLSESYILDIYVNGVYNASVDLISLNDRGATAKIGVAAGTYFDGLIGNVQIWNSAFTPDDVAYDYANPETPAYNRPGTLLTEDNLKGWWPLVAGSGDVAYDWSGNGNNGTLTNFTDPDNIGWHNGAGLSDPHVMQTALMSWGMGSNLLLNSIDFTEWAQGGNVFASVDTPNVYTGGDWVKETADGTTSYASVAQLIDSNVLVDNEQYIIGFMLKTATDDFEIGFYDSTAKSYRANAEFSWSGNDITLGTCIGCTLGSIEISTGVHWVYLIVDANLVVGANQHKLYFFPNNRAVAVGYQYIGAAYMTKGTEAPSLAITHALPATNALTPIRTWETAGQFKREYNELNFNGRSYADCGNGPDVNPTSALIVEMVVNTKSDLSASKFIIYGKNFSPYISTGGALIWPITTDTESQYPLTTGFNDTALTHVVLMFSAHGQVAKIYTNSSLRSTRTFSDTSSIKANVNNLSIAVDSSAALTGQLPLFNMLIDADAQKIIDGDLDAWVEKRYANAQRKYGVA